MGRAITILGAGIVSLLLLQGAIFAVLVYGGLPLLIAGLILCEARAKPSSNVDGEELRREREQQEASLHMLREMQDRLREEKHQIYRQGDTQGVARRSSDGRFDGRGKGRTLNGKLSKLDRLFETVTDEIWSERTDAAERDQRRNDEDEDRKDRHGWIINCRCALAAYVLVLLLVWFTPWSSAVSAYVEKSIWFDLPQLRLLYGPMAIATALAAVQIAVFWTIHQNRWKAAIDTNSIDWDYENDIEEFTQADDPLDFDGAADSQDECDEDAGDEAVETPYEVLGIQPTASRDEIVSAYRGLVKQYHPDLLRSFGPKLRDLAEQETQRLNWAKDEALKRA